MGIGVSAPMTPEELAQLAAGLPMAEFELPQATRTRRLLATIAARDEALAKRERANMATCDQRDDYRIERDQARARLAQLEASIADKMIEAHGKGQESASERIAQLESALRECAGNPWGAQSIAMRALAALEKTT